jgi:translation initiation factor 2 alpha subunit (eIF-2alpha)
MKNKEVILKYLESNSNDDNLIGLQLLFQQEMTSLETQLFFWNLKQDKFGSLYNAFEEKFQKKFNKTAKREILDKYEKDKTLIV